MSTHTKVQLISSDNKKFEVETCVIHESELLKNLTEDIGTRNSILLSNVSSTTLTKVINYCRYHVNCRESSDGKQEVPKEEIQQWDANFCKLDYPTLAGLIEAADYLNITSLLNLACQTVADMIIGKTTQEIRDIFNIENDFTPEEEEQIRKENAWALQ